MKVKGDRLGLCYCEIQKAKAWRNWGLAVVPFEGKTRLREMAAWARGLLLLLTYFHRAMP